MSKSDQTKAYIIERTASLFNKKGFTGTSLSDMTAATGLTKGSIYGNFSSKDEVALAAFDHNLAKIKNIIQAELSGLNNAKEKLLVYVDVYFNFLQHPFPEGGCPIMNTAVESDDTHAALKKRAADAVESWKKSIIKNIESGISRKEFKGKINPEATAISMIATIEGAIMLTKLTGKISYRNLALENLKTMINAL